MRHLMLTALLTSCAAQPTFAQDLIDKDHMDTMEIMWEADDLGIIHLFNAQGTRPLGYEIGETWVNRYIIDTPEGEVVILQEVTPNAACPEPGCPDSFEVVSWPVGYIAYPAGLVLAEGGSGTIQIMPWEGM